MGELFPWFQISIATLRQYWIEFLKRIIIWNVYFSVPLLSILPYGVYQK